jgi:hypothetical protein
MAIAVQGAVGDISSKAVTKLTTYDFNSMGVINGVAIGVNENGIFKLNDSENINVGNYSFTLATSDFGFNNIKRIRYIYIELTATISPEITFIIDGIPGKRSYLCQLKKSGLQRIRIPISRDEQGTLWAIIFSSNRQFRVNKIEALFNIRSRGVRG